ncbi:hypothetical protein L332_06755 [Agrococcus pavilionensis RW1]|uniref:YCII-related domain-containing protein n=1 Tax=Agrococcus pavilionensis RW1 TaxID=1330458 RepID=U1LP10_9MICO|nr:YciI family protein [Agrococcus pavilionensis]ERG64154.1 hypothetical protein L332_06755 [Agrococcus pavilionensis RW1]
MIAVIASFTDDPARLELRPRHRERLVELHEQGLVVAAGPFGDQSGSLVLFDTDDLDEVRAAIDADPYYSAPGVTVETIQPWSIIAGAIG